MSSADRLGIKWIEGIEMISVIFIRDYIQLIFEGISDTASISAFTFPTISYNNISYNIGTNEYRNILCSLINQKVEKVLLVENESIKIIFEGNAIIDISLRKEDCEGPEAAMFMRKGEIIVW